MSGMSKRVVLVVVAVAVLLVAAPAALAAGGVPRPDHIVVVMEENHSASAIYGNTANAPYINSLAQAGAKMTQSFAITHPSQPNYLALFSGSQQGVIDDSCPHTFTGVANLGADLIAAGDTFGGYSEDLPAAGSTVCGSGNYARKHVPWVNFDNVPSADNRQFSAWPSADFTQLPTVSFVIPNLCDDMNSCPISTGDTWLQNNIDSYAQWAKTHNSVLIVTWDEDDSSGNNQIATIFYGAGIKPGTYSESINHYNVLRTIEDAYGLQHDANAGSATPITDIWATPGPTVTVTNPGTQTAAVGTSASLQMHATASDGGAVTYAATGLPAGLTISSAGLISGTPTSAGTSMVTVTAAEASGTSGTATFTWTVSPQPVIVTVTSPGDQTGMVGTAASLQIHATASDGGTVTYAATGLPAGLTISSAGLISGTPTSAGTSMVTVTAAEASGTSGTATFTWTVSPQPVIVTVTSPGDQTGMVGTAASLQIHATASDGGTVTYAATGLPAGLGISSAGLISGTPTTAATSTVTIKAADASGTSGTATFTWTVTPRPSLSKLSIRPKAFSAAPRGGSIAGKPPKAKRHRSPIGTRVTYIDSAAATATFTVWKTVFGNRRGKSCVKARGTVPHHARCQLLVALGSFKHSDVAGANRFEFTGRIKGHKLRPGKYLLSATPAGGVAVTIRFRIR